MVAIETGEVTTDGEIQTVVAMMGNMEEAVAARAGAGTTAEIGIEDHARGQENALPRDIAMNLENEIGTETDPVTAIETEKGNVTVTAIDGDNLFSKASDVCCLGSGVSAWTQLSCCINLTKHSTGCYRFKSSSSMAVLSKYENAILQQSSDWSYIVAVMLP